MAVLAIAGLGGFAPAKADVGMGLTSGYMAVPASERWAAVHSRGNEDLETSAAAIEAAVKSNDQAEAGELLAQLYSGAAARAAAPVYAAPARAAAVSRASSEDGEGKTGDKGEGKEEGKTDGKEDKPDAPKPEEVKPEAVKPALDPYQQMQANWQAAQEAAAAKAKEKEEERKKEAAALKSFCFWSCVLAVCLIALVVLL